MSSTSQRFVRIAACALGLLVGGLTPGRTKAHEPPQDKKAEKKGEYTPNYRSALKRTLRWPHFPLHIFFNNTDRSLDSLKSHVRLGFDLWVKATGKKVSYVVTQEPDKAEIAVFYDLKPAPVLMGEMGVAGVSYDPTTKQLLKSKIHLIVWKNMSEEDLHKFQATAGHEFGHALGIGGHSPEPHDLMYPVITGQDVTSQDLNTLKSIYQGFAHTGEKPDRKDPRP